MQYLKRITKMVWQKQDIYIDNVTLQHSFVMSFFIRHTNFYRHDITMLLNIANRTGTATTTATTTKRNCIVRALYL